MRTVTQSHGTVNLDTALRTLAAQATTRYAGEQARIERGLALALNGHVTLHTDGTASVQSGTDAEVVYTVNGHCDCPDATRAPEGRCKHRWSKVLVKRAMTLVAQANADVWYATYTAPDGLGTQGTAQYVTGHGWLFVAEVGAVLAYVSEKALVLGGNVALLEAQRAADGDLVRKVCGY